MSPNSLWTRVARARLLRVLLVYLGAAWLVLQVTNELRDALSLPQWVSPVAVLLLLVGLLIVGFTAWVQTQPAARAESSSAEIPSSWDLKVRELGDALARGKLPHPTWARVIVGGVVAFSLLFGVAGLVVLVRNGSRNEGTAAESAAPPAIAVLPFGVTGAGLDVWREGMVHLLSTNLDGIGAVRTINSRTVLSRWRERLGDAADPDLSVMLDVARRTGARYALVGTAVTLGPGVRLAGVVHDLEDGREIGSSQVDGPADSVMVLVDRLSFGILGAIGEHVGTDSVRLPNLGSITTQSVPALKAYVEGMSFFQRSDFARAISAFDRAIAADSTFALAYYRLSEAQGWTFGSDLQAGGRYAQRISQLVDRLPAREAQLHQVRMAYFRGDLNGIALARRATETYREDPEAWYQYGDFLWHLGDQALLDQSESARALEQAIRLDPSFAPYYIHLVAHAIQVGDSARAAALMQTYGKLAARDDSRREMQHIAFALAFADSSNAGRMEARLDSIGDSVTLLRAANTLNYLPTLDLRPRNVLASESVSKAYRRVAPADALAPVLVAFGQTLLGKTGEARALIASDERIPAVFRAAVFYNIHRMGVELPAGVSDRELAVLANDSVPLRNLFAGVHAAVRGRWQDYERATAAATRTVERAAASNDSSAIRLAEGARGALLAFGTWRRGDAASALVAFEAVRRECTGQDQRYAVNFWVRMWIGDLLASENRPAEAVRYYRTAAFHPYNQYVLGGLYEKLGDTAAARRAYALALETWTNADPEFPLKARATEALTRLGGDRARQ